MTNSASKSKIFTYCGTLNGKRCAVEIATTGATLAECVAKARAEMVSQGYSEIEWQRTREGY